MKENFDLAAKEWDNNTSRIDRALKVALAIKKQIKIDKKMKGLEFGAGTGLLGFNLIKDIDYLTFMDTSSEMLKQVKIKLLKNEIKNADILHCNLLNESLDNKFDLIFTLMALHHIDDYKTVINKLAEALNPNGFICLSDLDREDGSFHDGNESIPHCGFEREEIAVELKKYSIKDIKSSTVFVNKKLVGDELREYPVFLITGQKE